MLNPASAPSEMTAPSHTKLYNEDEMTVNDLLHISSPAHPFFPSLCVFKFIQL